MTEKDYSGATASKIGKNAKVIANASKPPLEVKSKKDKQNSASDKLKSEKITINKKSKENSIFSKEQIESYRKAGQIAKQIKEFAKQIIKPDEKLADIAEKLEAKILELGGELAFPINLSIDDVAAHYTPALNDETIASNLLKVDIGVHVNGCIADTAITLDLTKEKKYAKIIEATEKALAEAQKVIEKNKDKTMLKDIGGAIHETITKAGFSPIRNLSGHSLGEFKIHAGLTIPNYDNGNTKEVGKGAFAIEPFATTGSGIVYEGASSNSYHVIKESNIRDSFARKILEWLAENKKALAFSEREIEKKFGTRTKLALKMLEQTGIISSFAQLIEKTHQPVTQAENTLLIHGGKVEILS